MGNDRKLWWSELPPELLILIWKRLNSRLFILRFRAVCRSWRSCCPLPPYSNILSPHCPRVLDRCSVIASAVFVIEPLGGSGAKPGCWVVMVDEIKPGRLSIRYPLSKYRVLQSMEGSFDMLNVMDLRITEVIRSYSLKPKNTRFAFCWNNAVDKVLLFPDLDLSRDPHCLYLAMLRETGDLTIFHYVKGKGGSKFTNLFGSTQPRFEDIVKFNGRIYGINRRGRAYTIDCETFEMIKISAPVPRAVSKRRKRLVESEGDLYLVAMKKKIVGDSIRFIVYKLSEKEGIWMEVQSFNNRAIFIGADCSFTLPAQAYGLQDNCIYTYGNSFRKYRSVYGRGDHFEIEDRHSSEHWIGAFHLENGGHFGPMDSCDVLWPPPTWLVPNNHVSGPSVSYRRGRLEGFGLCINNSSSRKSPEFLHAGALGGSNNIDLGSLLLNLSKP